MTRAGKRSWLAALLSLLLVVTMAAPALGQAPALTSEDAIRFLVEHQIVQGDERGNLNLDKTITRAELAKIVVVAKGNADIVPVLAPIVSFADARGHWGAGYIEAAARMGLVRGRDANTFDPNAPITYAEALTILLRMVGQEPLVWSPEAVMQRAAQLGIIDASAVVLANLPVPRGVVFESLTRTMVQVPLADGSTLARELDREPPALTVSAPATTAADKVTVAGTATGAYAVTVNGVAASLVNGAFTAEVALNPGANTITVVAYDVAGNQTTKTVTVVRGGEVAAISVSGPTSVKAGESVTLTLRPTDAQGNVLPGSVLTATVSDGMGTMDTATGRFTAGTKAGRATITFTAQTGVTETYEIDVLGLAAEAAGLRIREANLTAGKNSTVEVEVVAADGTPVTYDDGRLVTLRATGLDGVVITPSSARTEGGVARFSVRSNETGEAQLTATSNGLTTATADVVFATDMRIVLVPEKTSVLTTDSSVTIVAYLRDSDGNAVANNTGADIQVAVQQTSEYSYLTSTQLVIRRGQSNSAASGYSAVLVPGAIAETVRITGSITSSHDLSVIPVSISVREPSIGGARKLDVTVSRRTVDLTKGQDSVKITARVVDNEGNTVTTGSYAFQVKLSTWNPDDEGAAVPMGLNLYLGDTGYSPIYGDDDAVVARTRNGSASMVLEFTRAGLVTVEVVGVKATDEAVDDTGEWGKATAGTSLESEKETISVLNTPSRLLVTPASPEVAPELEDNPVALLSASSSSSVKVNVYLLDEAGGRIPVNQGTVTMSSESASVSRLSGTSASKSFKDGVAEFTLTGLRRKGQDVWTVSYTSGPATGIASQTLTVIANDGKLDPPVIEKIYGESGAENRIGESDDYMEIFVYPYDEGEYGYFKVYRRGDTRNAIYTSPIMDLSGDLSIKVPVGVLRNSDRYQVSVHNGYGESALSDAWPVDGYVVKETPKEIDITNVHYDYAEQTLTFSASGVKSTGDVISERLYLDNPSLRSKAWYETQSLDGIACEPQSNKVVCYDVDIDPAYFDGRVYLRSQDGWYVDYSSSTTALADTDTADNRISPMAYIAYATVDSTGKKLTLYGAGLNDGSLYLQNIYLDDVAIGKANDTGKKASSASSYTITLSSAVAAGTVLDADEGWLRLTASGKTYYNAPMLDIPIVKPVTVSQVHYDGAKLTITGSGFAPADGDADLGINAAEISIEKSDGTPILTRLTGGEGVIRSAKQIVIPLTADEIAAINSAGNTALYLVAKPTVKGGAVTSWIEFADGWFGTGFSERVRK